MWLILALSQMNPFLRPVEFKLKPLGRRDLFQEGRQIYQLVLTYQFTVTKACEVSPILPAISDYLYENELDSQIWMVFSSQKQFFFAGEAYPSRVKDVLLQCFKRLAR